MFLFMRLTTSVTPFRNHLSTNICRAQFPSEKVLSEKNADVLKPATDVLSAPRTSPDALLQSNKLQEKMSHNPINRDSAKLGMAFHGGSSHRRVRSSIFLTLNHRRIVQCAARFYDYAALRYIGGAFFLTTHLLSCSFPVISKENLKKAQLSDIVRVCLC